VPIISAEISAFAAFHDFVKHYKKLAHAHVTPVVLFMLSYRWSVKAYVRVTAHFHSRKFEVTIFNF
jgi:hypothetical protein